MLESNELRTRVEPRGVLGLTQTLSWHQRLYSRKVWDRRAIQFVCVEFCVFSHFRNIWWLCGEIRIVNCVLQYIGFECIRLHPLHPTYFSDFDPFFEHYMPKKRNSAASRRLKNIVRAKNHVVRLCQFRRVIFEEQCSVENTTFKNSSETIVAESDSDPASDFVLEIHCDEFSSEELNQTG